MKTESNALYILRLALTLLIITGVMAAALAGVNAITAQRIADIEAEKTQAALAKVLPGAEDLTELPLDSDAGIVKAVYKPADSSPVQGYAVQVAPAGFDGEISMMVGIDAEGKVVAISIISHTETAGLGAVAAADSAKGQAFRQQFVGADAALTVGSDIDALTGATITSSAVTDGVNAALEYVANLK